MHHFRFVVWHGLFEVTVELQRMAALAGARVGWCSHVGASRSGTLGLGRHRRIVRI